VYADTGDNSDFSKDRLVSTLLYFAIQFWYFHFSIRMNLPHPHPLALFVLVPLNHRAKEVLTHPSNEHLVSRLSRPGEHDKLVLNIGHVRSVSGYTTVANLGRFGDVFVEGPSISRIHCLFEIHPVSKVVMFYDKSINQTSGVDGKNAMPFDHLRPRKVVVLPDFNDITEMDWPDNPVRFQLIWRYRSPVAMLDFIENREMDTLQDHPRVAQIREPPPSQWQNTIHTSLPSQQEMRWRKIGGSLGAGRYGEVYRVVDCDNGNLMAVKILKPPAVASEQWEIFRTLLKREVENLSRISHVSRAYPKRLFP
jgi:hypothetical protein